MNLNERYRAMGQWAESWGPNWDPPRKKNSHNDVGMFIEEIP